MLCVIYRSPKRDQTYLYVEKRDDFTRVPEELIKSFGQPQFSMMLNLNNRNKLATADIDKVREALTGQGYYLQVPPPPESLLQMHLDIQRK
ncbi:YcgL domain-containing protein [Edaphovirga cremea]|uniref:YcgL domain-containing protein n=1 Tax=Edaphovirga cremea TaxID=2267246 RepID=UPI000DEF9D8B|nr:YcgL domain-containing protein [Edaphovirga cremea]